MTGIDPGSAREEAERLVATVLAAARLAGSGHEGSPFGPVGDAISGLLGQPTPAPAGGTRFATGSSECCVCPICRTITALRDPSPEFAERLATGAGDFAAGVASLLRALGTAAGSVGNPTAPTGPDRPAPASTPAAETTQEGRAPAPRAETRPAPGAGTGPDRGEPASGSPAGSGATPPSGPAELDDEVWRVATRSGHDSWPAPERDVWSAATDGIAEAPTSGANPPGDDAGSVRPGPADRAGHRPVVPATRVPPASAPDRDDTPGSGA
jgi:hypothetical protein